MIYECVLVCDIWQALGEEQSPDRTGATLVVVLEQELANIEALKELFKLHDELLGAIETLTSKCNKVKERKKELTRQGGLGEE